MGFKAIRESWNRNRKEMGDQDAKRRKLKEKKKGSLHGFYLTVLRKSFYIYWSAGRSPRVHEVNPGRDPSERQRASPHRSFLFLVFTEELDV